MKEGGRHKRNEKVGQREEDGKKPRKTETETPQPPRDTHTRDGETGKIRDCARRQAEQTENTGRQK